MKFSRNAQRLSLADGSTPQLNRPKHDQAEFEALLNAARQGSPSAKAEFFASFRKFVKLLIEVALPSHPDRNAQFDRILHLTQFDALKNFSTFRGNTPGEFQIWLKPILYGQLNAVRRDQKHGPLPDVPEQHSIWGPPRNSTPTDTIVDFKTLPPPSDPKPPTPDSLRSAWTDIFKQLNDPDPT